MEKVVLFVNIPVDYKKYLKRKVVDEETTMTDYIIQLIEKDMKESEGKA